MKINLKKLGEQAIETTTGSKNMRLSENATSMVFQLFTKNVYSNPIGTVVREITSNCFDSHIEAGINKPVIIRLSEDKETGTKYVSFIDFGVGMSPDRVENIYGVYFESTKRVDNTQIGGFGIGGKTPLAYKRSTGNGVGEYDNSFYVITNYNGKKYYYCIYEGETSPVISLLHEEETTEDNGTEVRVPVLQKDIDKFANEMVRQLYYFENVIFEGFEDSYKHSILTNEYQIIRGKSFLFRGGDYGNNIHVCLGRVAYPIDYQALGLYSGDFNLPVAIRLEVGDINVTVSRESIDYSEETIKMLKKKLIEVKDEIKELLAKQYENIVTLEQYFDVKNNFGNLHFSNGKSMYVGNLIKQTDISFNSFAYNVLKMPNDKQLFKFFFNTRLFGKKPSRSRWVSRNDEFTGGYKELSNHNNLYYVNGEFNRVVLKQSYLKSIHETYHIIILKDITTIPDYVVRELFGAEMGDIQNDKGNLTAFGKTLIKMQKEYMSIVRQSAVNYDKLEVPVEFIEERKRSRKMVTEEMREQTIPVKFIGGYSGRKRVKLEYFFKYNMPIFYGTQDDNNAFENAVRLYNALFGENRIVVNHSTYTNENFGFYTRYSRRDKSLNSIMFLQLSKTNIKYMEFCKNAHHINEFKVRMAYRKEDRVRQYLMSDMVINKFEEVNDLFRSTYFNKIDSTWGAIVDNVREYINSIPILVQERYHKQFIRNYYGIVDDEPTNEQKKIMGDIDNLLFLQKANEDVMKYINVPYNLNTAEDSFFELMKKVLSL